MQRTVSDNLQQQLREMDAEEVLLDRQQGGKEDSMSFDPFCIGPRSESAPMLQTLHGARVPGLDLASLPSGEFEELLSQAEADNNQVS